jgi:hypothetical protein
LRLHRCQFTDHHLINVTPHPIFTSLIGFDERMANVLEVLGGMFVLGRIAAADVSATQAETQVNPRVVGFHAVFAHMLVGVRDFNSIQVRTFNSHHSRLWNITSV